MDIKIINDKPLNQEEVQEIVEESLEDEETGKVTDGNEGEIHQIAVKQVLDVGRDDASYDDEVKTLVKWAREKVGDDPLDIKWAIRDLQMRLGTPTFGDSVKHIARFAYLDSEERRIKQAKRQFS